MAAEIGLVLYPGVQMAAVLGMTDLFQAATALAARKGAAAPALAVSHWGLEAGRPVRVDGVDAPGKPAVLVLPPPAGSAPP